MKGQLKKIQFKIVNKKEGDSKMIKRMNRKGVSPLIATVLLIAFAVALGAIVMNWGRTYIDDTQDTARQGSEGLVTCSSAVNLKIDVLKAIVNRDGDNVENVELSLENRGGMELPEFVVKFYDENSGEGVAIVHNQTFKKYRTSKYNFTFDDSSGDLGTINDTLKNVTRITTIPFIGDSFKS